MRGTDLVILPPLTLLALGYIVGVLTGLILGLLNKRPRPHGGAK